MSGVGGALLGDYTVHGLLARGGMAEILYAERAGSPQKFAIKRMLPRLAADAELHHLFIDEGKLAERMSHPNIVRAFEVDEQEPFLVMEYLHGVTLGRLIREAVKREHRMPIAQGVAIVRGIAAGLHYAHRMCDEAGAPLNLVHRDISPNNIIVTFDGGVKLIDFGIAKGTQRTLATRTGSLRGTVPYMSPEQARSEPVDSRSDIFSASIMLWELTVGKPLFPRGSELETLTAISTDDAPKPSKFVPDFPPELEEIIMKGLARNREHRYKSAGELDEALVNFSRESTEASSLASYTQSLFPDDLGGPKLNAWAQLKARALPKSGPRTEEMTTPAHGTGRRNKVVVLSAASLVVLATVAMLRWGTKTAPPAHAEVPTAIAPPTATSTATSTAIPTPTATVTATANPNPKAAHKEPRKKTAPVAKPAQKTKFNLDGPGLPE